MIESIFLCEAEILRPKTKASCNKLRKGHAIKSVTNWPLFFFFFFTYIHFTVAYNAFHSDLFPLSESSSLHFL